MAQLVLEVVSAMNGAKADLLGRLDTELLADVKADAEYAVLAGRYLTLPPPFPALYTNDVFQKALHAKNQVNTVSHSDSALDSIGRAIITLFTASEVATKKTNAFQSSHLDVYREGLENLMARMDPRSRCQWGGQINIGYTTYTCAFNGRTVRAEFWTANGYYTINGGPQISGFIDTAVVERIVMHDTAYVLAQRDWIGSQAARVSVVDAGRLTGCVCRVVAAVV